MNSLELFNQIYANEVERTYEKSLLDFFLMIVLPRLKGRSPRVLDLGAGSKSIFEDTDLVKKNIMACDFSPVAILKAQGHGEIEYKELDITLPLVWEKSSYDLIFDSHCLHCITDLSKRRQAFINIYNALSTDGLFCTEMMIKSARSTFLPANKYVVDSRVIEDEILSYGFKILYFVIVKDLVFTNESGECDLVRVVCRK